MREDALRSVIRYLVEVSRKFDIKMLDSIGGLGDMQRYAQDHGLQLLGCGTARCAFKLTSKKVLKLARNEKGVAQNSTEVEIFTDPSSKPIIAQVLSAGRGYKWIVSELVRPIKDDVEFQSLTGVKVEDFKLYIKELKKKRGRPGSTTPPLTPPSQEKSPLTPPSQEKSQGPATRADRPPRPAQVARVAPVKTQKDTDTDDTIRDEAVDLTRTSHSDVLNRYKGEARKFLESVASMMDSADLLGGDLKFIDHWGKTPDGRVVLLDYGFTGDVFVKHYKDRSSTQ